MRPEMTIAVSAQKQELRVHMASAILERPEFSVQALLPDQLNRVPEIGARALLLEATRAGPAIGVSGLAELARTVPVIAVCSEVNRTVAGKYLALGVRAVLLAQRSTRTFQSALLTVLDGGAWIDPRILAAFLNTGFHDFLDLTRLGGSGSPTDEFGAAPSYSRDLVGSRMGSTPNSSRNPLSAGPVGQSDRREADPLVSRIESGQSDVSLRDRLSGREGQVAELVGLGMANSEIAAQLGVDESTVKTHVGSILRKVGLRDRLQIALWFHGLPIGRSD